MIESLQHRFLTLFVSLSQQDQQALLESFLVHNFAVWQYGSEDQLSPENASDIPLGATHHEAFDTLMARLSRLATLEDKQQDKPASSPHTTAPDPEDFDDVFDNIFSDQDPLNTAEQQQVMQKFLEASIAAILLLKSKNPSEPN